MDQETTHQPEDQPGGSGSGEWTGKVQGSHGNRVTGTTTPAPSQGNDGGDSNPTGAGGNKVG